MKHRAVGSLCAALVGLLLPSTASPLQAAPGQLDTITPFNPALTVSSGSVYVQTTVIQPDKKIILGGNFTSAGGVTRERIARFNTDGSLDTSFAPPSLNGSVYCILLQDDGKLVIIGGFTTVGGASQPRIARLNSDGTQDTGFTPSVSALIWGACYQADGKIVLFGQFTTVNSTTRNYLARLNSDGTLDTGFNPNPNAAVLTVVYQPDGKLLVGGNFSNITGVGLNRLVRLNSDGTRDTGFTSPGTSILPPVAIILQADGKFVLAESDIAGMPVLYRFNSSGSFDTGFSYTDPFNSTTYTIFGLALQANNYPIVFGNYNGGGSSLFHRVTTTGAHDTSFGGFSATEVESAALEANGRLIAGGFTSSPTPLGAARAQNGSSGTHLSVTNSNTRIQWFRGGTESTTASVTFELSTDGGSTWSNLGAGTTYVHGGTSTQWELTGLSLPTTGLIRARAVTFGGWHSLSRSIVEEITPLEPEIYITGNGQFITDGDTTPSTADHTDSGDVYTTIGSRVRTFTIRNDGGAPLTVSSIAFTGTDAADFSYSGITLPRTIQPHFTTTFDVTFDPGADGTRSATVTLTSDDPDVGSFDFALQGTGISPEINLKGNGVSIADGDTTPGSGDDTDFGTPAPGSNVVRTFTIENLGTTALNISTVTGNSEFVIGGISLPASVAASSSTTFTVTFTPSAPGTRSATIVVGSNDQNSPSYDFAVQGTGTVEINVQGNGTTIADGDTTPVSTDDTHFGLAVINAEQVVSTYTIQNLGNAPLSLSSISKSGTNASEYTVGGIFLPTTVAANGSKTFTVTFAPTAVGNRNATITIASNDSDEASYDFAVQGQGVEVGQVESTFNPNGSATTTILGYATAFQPDGKVVLSGTFTSVGATTRNRIARVNSDGSLDTGFNPNANGPVDTLIVQPDGKIVIGGEFTTIGGTTRNRIARLNSDGTLDTGFNPNANGNVYGMALQPDGDIVVAGAFTTIVATTRNRIARLNSDGTLDTGFNPSANNTVYSVALQEDGKILAYGAYTSIVATTRNRIARLNSDGTLDTSYNPNANGPVYSVALQSDGKAVIGGDFTTVGGATHTRAARVNTDGTVDTGFTGSANGIVYSIAMQTDSKPVLGGAMTQINATTRGRCGRLLSNSSLDTAFTDPTANNIVSSVALGQDGNPVLAGQFTTVDGSTRNHFAKLYNVVATETLSVTSSSRVQWLRGSSSPETQQVTFELSTDGGSTWSSLGNGTRISGGWELTGLSLSSGQIRATAVVRSGRMNGSSGLIQTVISF